MTPGHFGALDWVVLCLYFLVLISAAIILSRRSRRNTAEYFLAGRQMPVWAVAISILATAQSAATFLGAPEQAYAGNLVYLSTNLGGIIAGFILAAVFIPAYYRHGVETPYQLLTTRFGPGARLATSWAYMVGRIFASGARIYIGAIPVCAIVFGDLSPIHMSVSIAAFMVFGVLFTLVGGLTSVIWADVLQVCVYLGAAIVAIFVLASAITAPLPDVIAALSTAMPDGSSKLQLIDIGLVDGPGFLPFDPAAQFTLITACTGFVLMALAAHGADQDLVQRMLTCRSAVQGARSVIAGILIGLPAAAIFMAIGLLLFIFYQRPELMGCTATPSTDPEGFQAFLRFILHEMPPGLAGLMVAGVLAAGPAGINSSLNAMAATLISDVYRPRRPDRSERHYVRAGQVAVAGWGLVLGCFAVLCIWWKNLSGLDLINFALSVMTFAYAGQLGVFLTALFTRRGTTASAIAALAAGFLTVLLFQSWLWPEDLLLRLGDRTGIHGIAWPWHLVVGVLVSTAVCCCVPGRAARAEQPG